MEQQNEPTEISASPQMSTEPTIEVPGDRTSETPAKDVSLVPYAEESNEERVESPEMATLESTSVDQVPTDTVENETTFSEYRKPEENDLVESSDSSESDFDFPVQGNKSGSDDEHEEKKARNDPDKVKAFGSVRTKGEATLDDLPPIGELKITIGDNVNLTHLGEIMSIVGVLAEIEEKNLHTGTTVFYAADMSEYTHYVFLSQIQRMHGSDASWENNNEPPAQHLDYSDDEQERSAKRERVRQSRNNRQEKSDEEDEEEKEDNEAKPKRFPRKRGRGGRQHDNSHRGHHHDNNRGNKPKFPSAEFENPFLKVWPPPNDAQHQWSDNTPQPNSYGIMPEANSYTPPPRFHGYNPNQPPPGYPYQSSPYPPPPPPMDVRYMQSNAPDQSHFAPRHFPPSYGPPQPSQFGQQPRFPDYRLQSNNWHGQQ
ncbi:hypothetical protein CAPTEDRAFT_212561 [Capitella teleta]|uniref:Uncharacterized protein n=1 Tax=Capitella teleta TaxID=283909 RepID=R7V039_CAPTE|nr:hypothetical protein CAPTEDRAFT_212561 [Capitella teleta]|eukprot:ELU09547.1 hypothetical protein CAPTEDRAFT_212561 [Capitella teleta]